MSLLPSNSRPKAAGLRGLGPEDKQVVEFEIQQRGARSIWLLGIVGDWHPSFVKLQDHGQGLWVANIELAPGEYSYRLIIDGSWSDALAAVRTDAFLPSIATRFFSIPRIAVFEQDDRQDAETESSPPSDFRTSNKLVQQRGFIHHANRRN